MLDLLQTGKYGVLANQKFLGTTSNNINNVNTIGYVRQETHAYTNVVDWGIGSLYTRRMYDKYVQREMFRDQGNVGFYDAYAGGMSTVDTLLSKDDTSIATSINSLFSSMQEAVQNTTSVANRRELLTQFQNMVDRYHTLNYNITNEYNDVNARARDTVTNINDLVKGIYEVNRQVRNLGPSGEQSDVGLQLMDKRDTLIDQLSSLVDISVTHESDGSLSLYLGNGQLLVNGDTYGTLQVSTADLDPTRLEVNLEFNDPSKTKVYLGHDTWGGKLGGLLTSTDEIRQSMRDLGRLAIAFADAMNEQNKGGITLEGLAGKDLITIPTAKASSDKAGFDMTVSFNPGEGANVRNADYQVFFDPITNQPRIIMTDENGVETELAAGDFQVGTDANGNLSINIPGHGITMGFNQPLNNLVANDVHFLSQPTLHAAFDIKCNITKPEEFAFASAVRVNTDKHAGNAVGELVGVHHTSQTGAPSSDSAIFIDADGKPALSALAPTDVRYEKNAAGDFVFNIYASDGVTLLGTAPASCNGQNIFANTTWNDAEFTKAGLPVPTAGEGGYPGYEVNFTGTYVDGSSFKIEINEDGFNDNSNGNLLAQLQQEGTVYSNGKVKNTFTQSYADLTSAIGSAVMSATTDLQASTAKCEQSQALFYSEAGVNLDEEAANLIRYQQSYSACAKIISASQTIFDALISAI